MYAKNIVTAEDLAQLLDVVFDHNQRGRVIGVLYFDKDQKPVEVAYLEVVTDSPGLVIDPKDPGRDIADVLNPPVADPYKVPATLTVAQLEKLAR